MTRARFVERAERLAALFAGGRAGHGGQAHRVSPRPLARGERTHLVALVRAGATFSNGKLAGRPGEETQPEAA